MSAAGQLRQYLALTAACEPLTTSVYNNNLGVRSENIDACARAFRNSVGYYTSIFIEIGVGMAPGCDDAITTRPDEGATNGQKANQVAQDGWTCLAKYASGPTSAIVFDSFGINTGIYKGTTAIPYCIAAASGEVAGDELATEYSGCTNGLRRMGLSPD